MSTTEIGIGVNREHKDTLFRKIFGTIGFKKITRIFTLKN